MAEADAHGPAPKARPAVLPPAGRGLSRARRRAGLALACAGLPALTAVLVALRGTLALGSVLLLYLLAVVVVAALGGALPAVTAALASFLLANWFLTPPYRTFAVERGDSVIELVVFLLVAVTVSAIVDIAARLRVAEARSRVEAGLLSRFTAEPVAALSPAEVLKQVTATFGLQAAAVVEQLPSGERVVASVGSAPPGSATITVPAGPGLRLVGEGPELFAEDRRLLTSLAGAAGRAVEAQRLADEAAQGRQLEEVDRLRSALLAAVGHELRTPLAGIKAAVSSLRQHDVAWTPDDQEQLLATIEESADQLSDLVANLLDMSRLQAHALSVHPRPVALDEVVARALIGTHPDDLAGAIPDDLPLVLADPGLLERAVANLVANAGRHAAPGTPVRLEADVEGGAVRLRVIDAGPGVAEADWERMFAPFQRMDDRSGTGVGLGLAIARGFVEAMGGTLMPAATPGGGLTMTVTLPVAP